MKKQGFTLSEVLITLTLIGIITTLTIPSLVASTDKAKKATTLKKAYNSISGAYSQAITAKPGITNLADLTNTITKYLNVKYYLADNSGTLTKTAENGAVAGKEHSTNWIVTEDGLGYQIYQTDEDAVCTKDKVAFVTASEYNPINSCYIITIDIDGPTKGDNVDAVVTLDNNEIAAITGDRFSVFATKTGLTVGSATWSSGTGYETKRAAGQVMEANE